MPKPLIYSASPYRSKTIEKEKAKENRAISQTRSLWIIGYRALCPHTMMGLPTPLEVENNEELEACQEEIMATCLQVLSTCDLLYLGDGWERSSGCIRERKHAMELNMPVIEGLCDAKHYLRRVYESQFYRLPISRSQASYVERK